MILHYLQVTTINELIKPSFLLIGEEEKHLFFMCGLRNFHLFYISMTVSASVYHNPLLISTVFKEAILRLCNSCSMVGSCGGLIGRYSSHPNPRPRGPGHTAMHSRKLLTLNNHRVQLSGDIWKGHRLIVLGNPIWCSHLGQTIS